MNFNKKECFNMQGVFGWIILWILMIITLIGFFSNYCDRFLIGVGLYGLIWIFFGSSFILIRKDCKEWNFFLSSSVIFFILWIILKTTGLCTILIHFLRFLFLQ